VDEGDRASKVSVDTVARWRGPTETGAFGSLSHKGPSWGRVGPTKARDGYRHRTSKERLPSEKRQWNGGLAGWLAKWLERDASDVASVGRQ
jgi:hypothetical protein